MSATASEYAVISIRSSRPVIYHRARSSGASVIIALIVAIVVGRCQEDALVSVPRERLDAMLNSDVANALRAEGHIIEPLYPWGGEPVAEKLTLRDVWNAVWHGNPRP